MGVVGKRLQQELCGISCLGLEEIQSKKHIATTRTFAKDIMTLEDLETAIATHAANCAQKLRSQQSLSWQVYVFIKTNRRKPHTPQYRKGIMLTLDAASNSSIAIVQAALKGLRLIYRKGYRYKKAGVVLHAIVPNQNVQQVLFSKYDKKKHQKLMNAIDTINHRTARNTVQLAIQKTEKKQDFYRRKCLSKQYTTKWNEILEIKI